MYRFVCFEDETLAIVIAFPSQLSSHLNQAAQFTCAGGRERAMIILDPISGNLVRIDLPVKPRG